MNILDEIMVYQSSDEQIISELKRRLTRLRRSCCYSQQRLSELSGVSIATIKRIEAKGGHDLSLVTIIHLLRTMTHLEGVDRLVPIVPESPYISRNGGKEARRISSKSCRK